MPTLIYIHGRGLKVSEQDEHDKWYGALQEGLTRLSPEPIPAITTDDLHLAYWSDIFYPTAPTPGNPQGLSPGEQTVVSAIMKGYRAARITGALAAMPGMTSVTTSSRVFGGIKLPHADGAAQAASDSFVQDVVKYFGLGYAAKVRVPFVNLLTDLPLRDGLTVVAHSFGTLIAYEVLIRSLGDINRSRQNAGKGPAEVDTLVTMGGPLGWAHSMQAILPIFAQDAIIEAANLEDEATAALNKIHAFFGSLFGTASAPPGPQPLPIDLFELPPNQFPPDGVERWFNIFDPRDPVSAEFGIGALTISDSFLWSSPPNQKERAYDVPIKNEYAPPASQAITVDAHNDRGYGKCAQLAQAVRDFWVRQP
jgi:hypothetical protein